MTVWWPIHTLPTTRLFEICPNMFRLTQMFKIWGKKDVRAMTSALSNLVVVVVVTAKYLSARKVVKRYQISLWRHRSWTDEATTSIPISSSSKSDFGPSSFNIHLKKWRKIEVDFLASFTGDTPERERSAVPLEQYDQIAR